MSIKKLGFFFPPQTLEQQLSYQEQDAAIVKSMKSDLDRFPKLERELQQLREENAYHRYYCSSALTA